MNASLGVLRRRHSSRCNGGIGQPRRSPCAKGQPAFVSTIGHRSGQSPGRHRPLDQPALIGNAPPPGELLYSRLTSPGARLPQSRTEAAPVNVNVDLGYPMGVDASYAYANPTMIGFTGGGSADGAQAAPIIMPVVGDWTVPPSHTQSYYGKASEKASPGVIRYSNA